MTARRLPRAQAAVRRLRALTLCGAATAVVAGCTLPQGLAPAQPSADLSRVVAPQPWQGRYSANPAVMRDAAGRVWQPDAGIAHGGQLVRTSAPIAGTASPALYQAQRRGALTFDIPVPAAGTYAVDLLLAETGGLHATQRVFDVLAQGTTRARGVDVAARVGLAHADHVVVPVLVTSGALHLELRGQVGAPSVGAVDVALVSSATTGERTAFDDTFTGPAGAAPSTTWQAQTGGRWGGGAELQAYTARPSNVALDGSGHLALTARRETYTGADGATNGYTSARLETGGQYSFRYGRVSAVMQVPTGTGYWPAFWGLGDTVGTATWPSSGEIDVAEVIGQRPAAVDGHVHGPTASGASFGPGYEQTAATSLALGFHTYSALWLPDSVTFSLDGKDYGTVDRADLPAGQLWVFDQPEHLVLNLAVGGAWAGAPDASTPSTATLLVDRTTVARW